MLINYIVDKKLAYIKIRLFGFFLQKSALGTKYEIQRMFSFKLFEYVKVSTLSFFNAFLIVVLGTLYFVLFSSNLVFALLYIKYVFIFLIPYIW